MLKNHFFSNPGGDDCIQGGGVDPSFFWAVFLLLDHATN